MIDAWGIPCEIALRWMSLAFADYKSTLVQVMAWCCQATSHHLSQCWPRSMSPFASPDYSYKGNEMHAALKTIFTNLFSWMKTVERWFSVWEVFNSLWPSDTIWRHKSASTLAQVMACRLTAPSHYLNQRWLIISKVQWHPSESNFTRDTPATSHWN